MHRSEWEWVRAGDRDWARESEWVREWGWQGGMEKEWDRNVTMSE